MSFAANLKYIKDTFGFSNYQLAKKLGCSQSSIKNWIEGKNLPHEKTRQWIAEYFGVTLAEMDGDEFPVLPPQGAKKAPTEISEREDGDPVTQEIFEFVRSASIEELAEVVRYIQFLKTKRVAK